MFSWKITPYRLWNILPKYMLNNVNDFAMLNVLIDLPQGWAMDPFFFIIITINITYLNLNRKIPLNKANNKPILASNKDINNELPFNSGWLVLKILDENVDTIRNWTTELSQELLFQSVTLLGALLILKKIVETVINKDEVFWFKSLKVSQLVYF